MMTVRSTSTSEHERRRRRRVKGRRRELALARVRHRVNSASEISRQTIIGELAASARRMVQCSLSLSLSLLFSSASGAHVCTSSAIQSNAKVTRASGRPAKLIRASETVTYISRFTLVRSTYVARIEFLSVAVGQLIFSAHENTSTDACTRAQASRRAARLFERRQ